MSEIPDRERWGVIRRRLNSTGLYQQFASVADLLASERPVRDGEVVGVPTLGHWYTGAGMAATDHHLTTAGGAKLYVQPEGPGVWHFGAWGPDPTGVEDTATMFKAMLEVAIPSATNVTVKMPGGRFIWINEQGPHRPTVRLTRGQKFWLKGDGSTVIDMQNGWSGGFGIGGGSHLTTYLAEPVDHEEVVCTLTDVTDLEVGDMLFFTCDDSLETGWNYDKIDLRRIVRIDGNSIMVHKPFRWPHSPTDTNHKIVAHWPCEANIDGVHFESPGSRIGSPKVSLNSLTGGKLTNGSFSGQTVGWTGGAFADGPHFVKCMGMEIDWDITNGRYCPMIGSSYGIRFHDATVKGIRHMDPNSWSEDCVFENLIGIQTQGVIQSHPSTGNIFRNITDALMDSNLAGYDLRGLGETVEHCRSVSPAPLGKSNTCAPLMKDEWLPYCEKFTRRVSDYYAPRLTIRHGRDGQTIYQRVNTYAFKGEWYEAKHNRIYIDPNCVISNREQGASFDYYANEQRGPLMVPTLDGWKSDGAPVDITAITQTNPAVITAAGHGLSDGDTVWFFSGDMAEKNPFEWYYTVSNATLDTFEVDADATAATAYTTGGKVTKQAATMRIDVACYPAAGQLGKLHLVAKLTGRSEELRTHSKSFIFRSYTHNNANQQGENYFITLRVAKNHDIAEARYHMSFDFVNPDILTLTPVSSFTSDPGNLSVSMSAEKHLRSAMLAEGTRFVYGDIGGRAYIDVTVDVASNGDVNWLIAEIEGWTHNPMPDEVIR